MNEKNYEFVTCRCVFEHKKNQNVAFFSKIAMKKKVHRDIWPIVHLKNVNLKKVTFSIGLLVGEFLKIIQQKLQFSIGLPLSIFFKNRQKLHIFNRVTPIDFLQK